MAETELVKVELPEPVSRRGVNEAQWRTLCDNLYPGANPKSVLMVLDYCAARKLDPMKKPVHIVPMQVKDAKTQRYEWRDVVMPGIYEYRTTATRTGTYLGHSEPTYGPDIVYKGVTAPEWCAMTMYRLVAGQRAEFPVRVFFREVVACTKDGEPNSRWARAPIQMMTKCTEAAGIREGWPEEVGGEPTADEMEGQHAMDAPSPSIVDVTPPALVVLERLPEALADRIERAFGTLGLTAGARLVRLNEYLLAPDGTDEEKADKLLAWCTVERTAQKTRPKGDGNGKGQSKATDAGAQAAAAPDAEGKGYAHVSGSVVPPVASNQAVAADTPKADEIFKKPAGPVVDF